MTDIMSESSISSIRSDAIKLSTPLPRKLPPISTQEKTQVVSQRRRSSLVEAFFDTTDSKISPLASADKEYRKKPYRQHSGERKNSDPHTEVRTEKKHARRDSIKEQLLKFKIKAGKVFEEVHERLVEDYGSTPISPTTMTNTALGIDFPDDDTSANEDRVLSPTFSQSSKKTISSDDLKASLRSKIRKQAEKVVERKRGSVQLTRRLKRRMTTHIEDMPTEVDIENVDSQIENSIKLGARYLNDAHYIIHPPDEEQFLFCTATYDKKTEGEFDHCFNVYNQKAQPFPEDDSLMAVELRSLRISDIENQFGQHHTTSTMFAYEKERRSEDDMDNFRWIMKEEEILSYIPAQSWNEYQAVHTETSYSGLNVCIDNITVQSALFNTSEEVMCNQLRLHFFRLYILLKNLESMHIQRSKSYDNSTVVQDISAIYQHNEHKLNMLLDSFKTSWATLQNQRHIQGYSLTNINVHYETEEGDVKHKIPKISEDHEITSLNDLPADVKRILEERKKREFYLILYYNGKKVGKTKTLSLSKGLYFKLDHVFTMEVTSNLIGLKATIFERKHIKDMPIASIDFPRPIQNDELCRDIIEFVSVPEDLSAVKPNISGTIVYRVGWEDYEKYRDTTKVIEDVAKRSNSGDFNLIPTLCRLVTDEDFDSNIRWEVLERRFRMKLSSKSSELRRIGFDSSEVDAQLLYEDDRKLGGICYRTGIDGHRFSGNNQSVALRRRVLERFVETCPEIRYDQIVQEEPIGAAVSFGSIFGPPDLSRKLKPMRKEYARQQAINVNSYNLIINIQSAINLPTRNRGNLQAIVEISFQNQKVCTTAAIGKHPNWQQTLRLTVDSANIDLRSIKDNIEINIYDQTVCQLNHDDREVNTVHEQLLRQLIGTLHLPFSTVYSKGKIDGGLRIKFPLFITGYKMPAKGSYLKLLLAVDPPMIPPRVIAGASRETSEPTKIMSQCTNWEKLLTTQFEDRRFTATVVDIYGKRILSSRYLRPIRPPPCVDNLIQAFSSTPSRLIDNLAQIVSYIPFVSDPMLFSGSVDMWTTADQFISMTCGDEEEHALLLCCWLLYLNQFSYVVLGNALPEGDNAAFVLVNMNGIMLLVNPTDGNSYHIDDVMCPLISVGTVISNMNVYGNIQPYVHPSQLSFDFTKNTHWKPLFDKDNLQLDSVQPSTLTYNEVSEDSLMELRSSIEREIKVGFDDSRQFAIPQWNLMASRLLRELLQDIDHVTPTLLEDKLLRLRDSYYVTVTAIRIPYKSLQHCVQSVLALNAHLNTDLSAQFALAVHITPYFNNIVSCSIALAVLTLKK